jgi:hypothetical protein
MGHAWPIEGDFWPTAIENEEAMGLLINELLAKAWSRTPR